jgi:RimJ/RimL family protein N-acetyltransferase
MSLDYSKLAKEVELKDGTRVLLRPEVPSDLEMVWEMHSTLSRKSLRFLPAPFTREKVEGWLRNLNYEHILPVLVVLKVGGRERVVGASTLMFFQDEANRHKAEFGITVHDDYQNLGLGTIMTEEMINIARRKGLKKVCLSVVSENRRAIKVYERCGLKVEGLMVKEHYNVHTGEYGDDYRMALLL